MHNILKFSVVDIAFIILMIVPGLALLATTGNVSIYFKYDVLGGQFAYIMSKFFGLYAIFFFAIQLLYGLYSSFTAKKININEQKRLHRTFGVVTLGLIMLHIGFFVLGVSIRNGYFTYHLLLPNLFGNYYPFMVSLGVIAFMLIMLSITSIIFFNKKSSRIARWGHRLMLPAFILILVHSYTIGSETRLFVIQLGYIVMLAGLAYYTGLKIFNLI